mgnify:CR=1 FL=1
MGHKIISAVCECWKVICRCSEWIAPHETNTIEYWKRIEHVDQPIPDYFHKKE